MKSLRNTLNIVDIVIEMCDFHLNKNGIVLVVDITKKRKQELSKIQKKINCINRIKYAEGKKLCICTEVYQLYEGSKYNKIYEFLSTLINKKLKINNILIEKYKDMIENPNFEQDQYSKTAMGIYKIDHDSIRIMKWICYYDRSFYENVNYYDLMGSILKFLNEISQR